MTETRGTYVTGNRDQQIQDLLDQIKAYQIYMYGREYTTREEWMRNLAVAIELGNRYEALVMSGKA